MLIRPMLAARLVAVLVGVLVLLSVSLETGAPSASADFVGKVYWTDDGTDKISRANLDGSGVEDLLTGLDSPQGIALDTDGGKMYWVETGTAPGKISRANLDGTGVEALVTADCCSAESYIALDTGGGKMYWTSHLEGKVKRANLDGSGAEVIVVSQQLPAGIAVDADTQKVYWSYQVGGIRRANLDGSGVEDFSSGGIAVGGLALDADNGVLYAAETFTGHPTLPSKSFISRFELDGTKISSAFHESNLVGLVDVAVNKGLESLFWTERGFGRLGEIRRWPDNDVIAGLDSPVGLALDISDAPKPPTATPSPFPVGGILLDEELRALPAATPPPPEAGSVTLVAGAALIGLAWLAGAAWYARRRHA